MKIIPHRGFWTSDLDKNSAEAILDALDLFDGVEIDLRDGDEEIVIEHDPFMEGMAFEDLLMTLNEEQKKKFFALNIKSDGLSRVLRILLNKHGIQNYMCFDMSFPESLNYKKNRLNRFSRMSDLEKLPQDLYEGVLVDGFFKDASPQKIASLKTKKMIISSEIHGRDPYSFWCDLKLVMKNDPDLMICTDIPCELSLMWQNND